MRSEIPLYENSVLRGRFSCNYVSEMWQMYRNFAIDAAKDLYRDEVILYCVCEYFSLNGAINSVALMMKAMPYTTYLRYAKNLSFSNRLFFIRGRKERHES